MGGETSVGDGDSKFGGKRRAVRLLPGGRARPGVLVELVGVMGEDVVFAAFRRAKYSLGVRSSMRQVLPGARVILVRSGVI